MGNCCTPKSKEDVKATAPRVVTRITVAKDAAEDRARGCIIGALCGDAIGVPVESQTFVSPEDAEKCLALPGGGPFKLGKGQITDASELALSLGNALVAGNGALDLNKIAAGYYKWYETGPFDLGVAMKNALVQAGNVDINQSVRVRKSALESQGSQTNSALMRIAPLCVWASKLNRDDLITAVREETRLTHPNVTAQNVSIVYAYTISHLLNNPGQYEQAYAKCKEMVEFLGDVNIKTWLAELENDKLPAASESATSVKIAFTYAIYHMRKNSKYEEGIIAVLRKGGNTDTNCCVAGAMLGALHGLSAIPERVVTQVLNFSAEVDGGVKRPDFLTPKVCAEGIITKIIAMRPTGLNIVGAESELEKSKIK